MTHSMQPYLGRHVGAGFPFQHGFLVGRYRQALVDGYQG